MDFLHNNINKFKEISEITSNFVNNKRRPAIKQISGMTCVIEEFTIKNIDREMNHMFDYIVNGIKDNIRYIYMVNMPTFVNKHKVEYASDTEYTNKKLITKVNRFIKYNCEKNMIRIIMNDRTLYVYISKGEIINIMTIEFFESQEVCLIRRNVIENDKVVIKGIGSMVLSRKTESANADFLREHNLISLENSNDYLNMISDSLNMYIKDIGEIDSNDYEYSSIELKTFLQLYNKSNSKFTSIESIIELKALNELATSDNNSNLEEFRDICRNGFNNDSVNNILNDVACGNIPFCNFTKREWNFVSKHMDESNLNFIKRDYVDIFDILSNQIYGPTLQFKYDDADIISYYTFDEKMELVKFYLFSVVDNNIIAYRTFICKNIHEFNCLESLSFMEFKILQRCVTAYNMARSINELTKGIYNCIMDESKSIEVLERALSVYLIIHDRPKKHCIVREEHHETSDTNPEAIKVSKVKHKKDTNKLSIKRILMPVKSAKEYIRINSSNPNSNRIYTIEEWERRGHYRHLKNGKTVWINETTCKRHKPITTDAQVVIKL